MVVAVVIVVMMAVMVMVVVAAAAAAAAAAAVLVVAVRRDSPGLCRRDAARAAECPSCAAIERRRGGAGRPRDTEVREGRGGEWSSAKNKIKIRVALRMKHHQVPPAAQLMQQPHTGL